MRAGSMKTTPSLAWLDGELLPFGEARIPLSDRGLLLGDSLFETLAVVNSRAFELDAHLQRLARGVAFAGHAGAPGTDVLARAVDTVIAAEVAGGASRHGTVRITVTRGPGPRGYSPRGAGPAHAFVVFHPGPEPCQPHPGWRLRTSLFRVPHGDVLALFKHGSRMLNVLARAEAEAAGADEALLLNTLGEPAECASGNILWFEGGLLRHAAADSGALAGVTQGVVLGLASRRGIRWSPGASPGDGLFGERLAEGGGMVLLSTLGVVPVLSLDGRPCRQREETAVLAADLVGRMRASS